jgi:hypothetical protein
VITLLLWARLMFLAALSVLVGLSVWTAWRMDEERGR